MGPYLRAPEVPGSRQVPNRGIRSDFERSFQTLRGLPADIFLGSHGNFFGLERKRAARAEASNPLEPFIDREGYLDYIDRAEKEFRELLAKQQ